VAKLIGDSSEDKPEPVQAEFETVPQN
jgi:hypothetical protein